MQLLTDFWYLWFLIAIAALYRLFRPSIKGWFGEKTISVILNTLPKDEYIILNNIYLPSNGDTTQVDHIVVSIYGIFVIETKNYKGWIFGSEKSVQWTQNIYGKKNSFMNPLRQNYAHVKAIENVMAVEYPSLPIIPIVAFSPECDLKVKVESHIIYFGQLKRVIREYMNVIILIDDVRSIADKLRDGIPVSREVRREHVAKIEQKKSDLKASVNAGICPQCGGSLVERSGKYGAFTGCSNYPKCRYILKK